MFRDQYHPTNVDILSNYVLNQNFSLTSTFNWRIKKELLITWNKYLLFDDYWLSPKKSLFEILLLIAGK